ncbi:hypothetical protein BKA70DRAFT_1227948 [Coprinopsis sp. MPI-PUGE-AT-0042]|nr:hypothetical protein BKA70DRAFT_1227948 [Coprinopsis sp. MPI-PUGE-AT-0042]
MFPNDYAAVKQAMQSTLFSAAGPTLDARVRSEAYGPIACFNALVRRSMLLDFSKENHCYGVTPQMFTLGLIEYNGRWGELSSGRRDRVARYQERSKAAHGLPPRAHKNSHGTLGRDDLADNGDNYIMPVAGGKPTTARGPCVPMQVPLSMTNYHSSKVFVCACAAPPWSHVIKRSPAKSKSQLGSGSKAFCAGASRYLTGSFPTRPPDERLNKVVHADECELGLPVFRAALKAQTCWQESGELSTYFVVES